MEYSPHSQTAGDHKTVTEASDVLHGNSKKNLVARILPFLGPAFVASVAYMDPGNFATNIQGGARFGYSLLWVVIASNVMAMIVQSLSAKLGIASGRNLAEACRDHFPKPLVWFMWIVAEVAAMATDLAEFLGASLGFQLLFNIPLFAGAVLTALFTLFILSLERYGFRSLETIITVLVGIIAACYLLETIIGNPDWGAIASGAISPRFEGSESVLIASGILGATVMPHVIYLHSALTQGRIVPRGASQMKALFRFQILDVTIAMGVAGLVNAAMLIMAAATFHTAGLSHIGSIEEAHRTLIPLLGNASSTIFAVSLLAAGLSSSAVGTMSGQIIMKGFVNLNMPVLLRRLITMAPTLLVIGMGFNPTRTLVVSQVILSFALPFAIIPLVMFTSRSDIMGILVNRKITSAVASAIALLVVSLNVYLLIITVKG